MSISPDQLGDIFRSLRQTFNDHPAISIRPLKGDPPEQYEIVYAISGYCKTGRNDINLAEEHRIELTIPFGFPHFPPSCKPKTDIFHPDFDPAAVCLGDFWQPGREVADLVIHLGRLINGELYSLDNAFNEEAAKWYSEHKDSFPLAEIPWEARTSPFNQTIGHPLPQVDTIEEEDLASDFDFFSLEKSIETSITQPPPTKEKTASHSEDIAYLQLLQSRKKYYKLRELLTATPPRSTDSEKLLTLCDAEVRKAEELYQSARRVEEAGNIKNASRLFHEVGAIVSDFPNIEEDQRRTEESLLLVNRKPEPAIDSTDDSPLSDWEESSPPPISQSKTSERKEKPKPVKPPVAVKGGLFSAKMATLLLGGTAILLAGGYFGINSYSSQQLQQAATELAACSAAFEKNAFEEAKSACDLAQQKVSPFLGLHKAESELLSKKLNEILSSEKLRQGLAGNLLVNGKYLPRKEAVALENFQRLQKEAEELFAQQQWADAEDRYGKLLSLAEKGPASDGNTIKEIKHRLGYLRFAKAFGNANALIGEGKWQEATTALQKAKGLLESLPEEERRRHEMELNAALAKCNFEEFRQLGDDFFSKSDWGKAIATYKSALPTAENNKLASQETLNELRQNIARAELYAAIDAGNKAFADANWEAAILEYNKAGNLLNSQMESIKTADAQFTRKKIDRIILQTIVIRDRQAAQTAEVDKQDPVTARNIYKQLVTTLNNSGFAGEDEFAEIKKTSLVAIDGLEKKIYLADKEKYLKDNFRRLFQLNYPAAVAENLANPQITFVKEAEGKLVFKMQCQETGQGRPLALVMFYAYDKNGNRWDFHSEQQ